MIRSMSRFEKINWCFFSMFYLESIMKFNTKPFSNLRNKKSDGQLKFDKSVLLEYENMGNGFPIFRRKLVISLSRINSGILQNNAVETKKLPYLHISYDSFSNPPPPLPHPLSFTIFAKTTYIYQTAHFVSH
jgi:hypothetical protein